MNNRLLRATRHRLAVSRRCLRCPNLRIAGGSGESGAKTSARARVRELLGSGALSPIRGGVQSAGYGSGQACCVCGDPISSLDMEYEVGDGESKAPRCHFACFVVWR